MQRERLCAPPLGHRVAMRPRVRSGIAPILDLGLIRSGVAARPVALRGCHAAPGHAQIGLCARMRGNAFA